MPHIIFIHGKNHQLSIAELMALIGKPPVEANKEFSVFDIFDTSGLMDRLGGTLKMAEAFSILETDAGEDEVCRCVEKHFGGLVRGLGGSRLLFGVSFYGGEEGRQAIEEAVKELAKPEGLKVSVAHSKEGRLTHTEILQKKVLQNGFEILVCMGKDKLYLAKTLVVHNPFEFRKRDLQRPVQRPIYSIPPRLARIMINLSGAARGDTLADTFCGIGTILQEASLMGIGVMGFDTKDSCIGDTRKNLRWLEREYGLKIPDMENKIRNVDARWLSSHVGKGSIDAIVTEPYMGPPLKRRPDRLHAMRILDSLKQMYEHSIKEMLQVLKSGRRICIVSPAFIVKNRFYGLDIKGMAGRNGGRLVNPLAGSSVRHELPLRDFEERHNTIREIYVIERV